MSLFATEPTVNNQFFINLARPLTIDDVDMVNFQHLPESHKSISSFIYIGLHISLKQSIVDELLVITKVNTRESGRYYDNGALGNITDEWSAQKPTVVDAQSRAAVKFTGRKTEDSKQKHLLTEIESVKSLWAAQKYDKRIEALHAIEKHLTDFFSKNNERVTETIRDIIVEQKVGDKWFEAKFSENDKTTVELNNTNINQFEKEIATLQAKIIASKASNYIIKRETLECAIINDKDMGSQTSDLVATFKEEKQAVNTGLFFSQ
jgi:hypothetical protein